MAFAREWLTIMVGWFYLGGGERKERS